MWVLRKLWGWIAAAGLFALWVLAQRDNAVLKHRIKEANRRDAKDQEGRNAVSEEQAETDGADVGDIVDRMRRRDGDWRGL